MQDSPEKSVLEQIVDVLQRHGVEFIVIGGQAEALMGSPRVTYDVDLCYSRSPENLARLSDALKELKVQLRGAPAGLPFIIDARTLEMGNNFTFTTPIVDLDLLAWVEPIGDFGKLNDRADVIRVGEVDLRVIALDDLIRVKRHINRPKDRESLFQLLAIKRIRDEGRRDI